MRKVLALARAALPLVIMAIALFGTVYAFKSARDRERSRIVEETIDTLKERDKLDGEINALDLPDLCRKLGGQWVSGACE